MYVITLLNEKGGVGKTTLAVHIAAGLALRGARVLLIDGDPQGHATIRTGFRKAAGIYDLMVRDAEWSESVQVVQQERFALPGDRLPEGRLWVLPGNVETRNIANSIGDVTRLAERLEELGDRVDVAIIDTSPTASLLHGAFYVATDALIYPTMLTYTAFDGLVESIKRRQQANAGRESRYGLPPIDILGIVPIGYRRVTNEQRENLETLKNQFGGAVWTPLAQRTLWTESESRALPVWNLDPNEEAAIEFWEVLDQVQGAMYEQA